MAHTLEEIDSAFRNAESLGRAGRWQAVRSALLPLRSDILRHAEASYLLAYAYVALSDLSEARDLAERSHDVARAAHDAEREMKCANLLGIIHFNNGDLDVAERYFAEALALAETSGADQLAAMAANNLGNIGGLRGSFDDAIRHYETALGIYRRRGDRFPEAQALHNLGIAHRDLDDWDAAEGHFAEAAWIAGECGEARLFASAVAGRADIRIRSGRLDEAELMARAALLRFDVQSDSSGLAEVYKILGVVARERGEMAEARGHLERALGYCDLNENPLITAEIRVERGLLLLRDGDPAAGRAELESAARLYERLQVTRQAKAARAHLQDPGPPAG